MVHIWPAKDLRHSIVFGSQIAVIGSMIFPFYVPTGVSFHVERGFADRSDIDRARSRVGSILKTPVRLLRC